MYKRQVLNNDNSRRRQTADRSDVVDNVEHDDRPIQQFATLFTTTDIRDGRFTARLPVDVMPRGDVMIRMRNGRLEVLQSEMIEEEQAPCRLHGVIELPMFVDSDSVIVHHDPLQNCLVIVATIKGYRRNLVRRRSRSMDDLWQSGCRKITRDLNVRQLFTRKRRELDHAVILYSEKSGVADSEEAIHWSYDRHTLRSRWYDVDLE